MSSLANIYGEINEFALMETDIMRIIAQPRRSNLPLLDLDIREETK